MFSLVPLTLFPDSILAISSGIIFGLVNGYIYTTIGALIGGTISFYISRKLGRNVVKKLIKEKLDKVENIKISYLRLSLEQYQEYLYL